MSMAQAPERTTRLARLRLVLPAAILTTVLAGCNLPGQLSASSTCKAYNNASAQSQQDVVLTLFHNAHPEQPKTGPAAANALLNVSYECQQEPNVTLGSLGDFRPGSY